MGITAQVETITPEIAKKYLETMGPNRSISPQKVQALAADILHGNYELNGEGLQFDEDGRLINGQHRCSAVIAANKPIQSLVIRGIAKDVHIFDKARVRSTSDTLKCGGMDKILASSKIVALVKFHFRVQYKNNLVSDSEVREFIMSHKEFLASTYKIAKGKKNSTLKINSVMALAIYYGVVLGYDYDKLTDFCRVYSSGLYENPKQKAAIILRNDVLNGNFPVHENAERLKFLYATEKAIDDFIYGYCRKQSYKSWSQAVFSNSAAVRR